MLGRRPGLTLAGIVVAALALALPGCLFMLAQAIGLPVSQVPIAEASVFVTPGTGAGDLKAMSTRIEALDGVSNVRLVARDQAWSDLQKRARDAQAFADIKPNPLPDVLVAQFAPRVAVSTVETTLVAIAKQPHVDSVQADLDWYRRLLGLARTATMLAVPLVAVVSLLVLLVPAGIVRLLAVIEPSELRLLEQIGAETDFVRRPFVYAGAFVLGMAGAAALGLMAAARFFANPPLAELGRTLGLELSVNFLPLPLILAFAAACLLAGAVCGNLFAAEQAERAKSGA